jgi:hypothetical protein
MSGWAASPVSDSDIESYWNAHKGDSAAQLQAAMVAYGVDRNRIARLDQRDHGILDAVSGPGGAGFDENGQAQLLFKPQESFGPDGDYFGADGQARYKAQLDAYNAQQAALQASLPKVKTQEQFMATVKPEMLDAQGKFKGPQAGVNYIFEGMTPDDAYSRFSSQHQPKSIDGDEGDTSSLSYWQNKQNAINGANATLDAGWREGPDNGGGFIGGLGRFAKGVLSIPPISMALTAGMAPMLGEAIGGATGWTAGTSNAVANGIIKGAQTMGSGGDIGDAIKSGALSYAGGQVGSTVGDAVGQAADSQTLGNIAGGLAKTAVTDGDLSRSLMGGVANAGLSALTSNIPGFNDLNDAQKSILTKALNIAISGKRISPKALIGLMPKKV